MPDLINQRIKQVRETLELSQRSFSSVLSLSHSYIANVETGSLKVNGRLVKLVVSEFTVNEDWLLTGKGEMFSQNPDEKFTKLVSLFKGLSPSHQELIYQIIALLLKLEESTTSL
ncbi:MAG: helix-turn-helix domain-containing protein [Spirochaetaceae bacterium]|jgi:transcriptional regulator with XRE-family HTH domain|nr:helix-turn-helix domain-containing protein [Spirochaetaceae bacterium]